MDHPGTPTAMRCPKCAGEMRMVERSGIHIERCTECRGIFLDRGELERLLDLEAETVAAVQAAQARTATWTPASDPGPDPYLRTPTGTTTTGAGPLGDPRGGYPADPRGGYPDDRRGDPDPRWAERRERWGDDDDDDDRWRDRDGRGRRRRGGFLGDLFEMFDD